MTARRGSARRARSPSPRGETASRALAQSPKDWFGWAGLACVVALTLLIPLHPTEANAETASEAPVMVAWLALAVLGVTFAGGGVREKKVGGASERDDRCPDGSAVGFPARAWAVGGSVAVLGAWILVSGHVAGPAGHYRLVLNAMGQWTAAVVSFFVMAVLFRRSVFQRVIVVVAVSVAAVSAASAIHEWRWVHPAVVRDYERNPEAVMRRAGVVAERGSAAWKQFEDRLRSTEPYGTFGLPNSLAGFLATWLVVTVGITMSGIERRDSWWWLAWLLVLAVLMVWALWLTKSRTALLASLVGAAGLAASRFVGNPRYAVLLAAAVVVGGLVAALAALAWIDPLVIAEAPLSVRYRLEYWMGSVALAKDHPWFGCGVGNFQAFYPQYMQPWSSETVADPHNFWFELLATAGGPAALAGLAVIVTALTLARRQREEGATVVPTPGRNASVGIVATSTGLGLVMGVVGLVVCLVTQGQFVEPLVALLALVIPGVGLLVGRSWLVRSVTPFSSSPPEAAQLKSVLPAPVVGWALVTWLVNACAAGAIGIWGVAHSGWLLLALWLNLVEPKGEAQAEAKKPGGIVATAEAWFRAAWVRPVLIVVLMVLLVGTWLRVVSPTARARMAMAHASAARTPAEAIRWCEEAGRADPWWGVPWEQLAELYWNDYLASRSDTIWERFEQSVREATSRDRHSAVLWRRIGDWYLAVYVTSQPESVRGGAEMVKAYRKAVALHPSNAFYHAQLAWAYHLTGDREAARTEAARALKLDRLVPHDELKLAHRHLYEGPGRAAETAERRMQQLRTK